MRERIEKSHSNANNKGRGMEQDSIFLDLIRVAAVIGIILWLIDWAF